MTTEEHFERFEAKIPHMYLDGEGIVTTGIGCRVFDPLDLPWQFDGRPALRAEVFNDYNAVKALPAGRLPSYYGAVCRCRLTDTAISDLFMARLQPFESEARQTLPEGAPAEALLVMTDMLFNLGIGGLRRKFPRFHDLMAAGRWRDASLECGRTNVQAARNDWAKDALWGLQ